MDAPTDWLTLVVGHWIKMLSLDDPITFKAKICKSRTFPL